MSASMGEGGNGCEHRGNRGGGGGWVKAQGEQVGLKQEADWAQKPGSQPMHAY